MKEITMWAVVNANGDIMYWTISNDIETSKESAFNSMKVWDIAEKQGYTVRKILITEVTN